MRKNLSLIIPAYNEERHIGACLDAIAAQTVMPGEVIVVDNGSTDNTAAIARLYPFVTLIFEPKPGLIAARNTGFSASSGDIMGRINADSEICSDWVEQALSAFESNERLGGLTGPALTDTLPLTSKFRSTLWPRYYFLWSELILDVKVMWGANMLIRRKAWDDIRSYASTVDSEVHEDQDLSILLSGHGWRLDYMRSLQIITPGQDYHAWPKLQEYMQRRIKTRDRHRRMGTISSSNENSVKLHRKISTVAVGIIPLGLFLSTSLVIYSGDIFKQTVRRYRKVFADL